MKLRTARAHMNAAQAYADLSYCNRRKVGCVAVKNDTVVSIGYNGTPSGEDNVCEDCNGNTKPSVIHAEMNTINKLKRDGHTSGEGMSLFVTTAPCSPCAAEIANFKFDAVYYRDSYRSDDGIHMLVELGIPVKQLL